MRHAVVVTVAALLSAAGASSWAQGPATRQVIADDPAVCDGESAADCAAAGRLLLKSHETPAVVARGLNLLEKACRAASADACAQLGHAYLSGAVVKRDAAVAAARLERACVLDDAAACSTLADLLDSEEGDNLLGPMRVGGALKEPRKLRGAPPVYPAKARQARVEGTVVLECVISRRGEVASARVIESVPLLDEAALEAVGRWRYEPAMLAGRPVPAVFVVRVPFTLD